MASEYGVYTLAEIYTQALGHAPTDASDLAMMRTYIKGLGGMPVSKTNINQYYMPNDFFNSVTRDAAKSLTVPSASASSAWQTYVESGSGISQLGSASQGGQLVKSAEIGYFRYPAQDSPSGYFYKPASLLSMPLPSVAAAVAPLAGVALGATMYQENPELWTKLSRALIPWAYPDSDGQAVDISKGLVPVWTEVAESAGELIARALLPAALVDSIKQFFNDEGIGTTPESGSIENTPAGVNKPLYYATVANGMTVSSGNSVYRWAVTGGPVHVCIDNAGRTIFSSPTPATVRCYVVEGGAGNVISLTNVTNTATIDGIIAYYRSMTAGLAQMLTLVPGLAVSATIGNVANTAWSLIHGNPVKSYPIGTSKWGDGTVYPLPQNPNQIILEDENGTEHPIDAYPVPLPITPGQSTDSTIQGINDPLVDIEEQVDPYIQPTPYPYSEPSPTPENPGQPDPRTDPSQPGEPSSPISPESPTQPPPPSDGDSPDPIPPLIPTPFTSEGGLIAVYNPSQSILIEFANWLWVTYQDATIQKIWNNPFDGVISLHELYCTPPVIGTRNIKSGFLDSEISSPIIARYTEINCGSIVIPEYWGNYLDYAPYTKAFVYLPFIGIIELEADDIVGHSVNITYRIDCYNGSCIAMITVAKQGPDGSIYNNTVYQYSGNCAVELPLTGGSQAAIKAAVINASAWGLGSAISGIMTALGGRPLTGLGQAVAGAIEATASVVNAKSSVQHSGTFGASFGAMGIKRPYIIVKRPIQVQVLNYNEIYGYQAHKAVTIGSCEGYLRCREVHVTSATANDEEKQLIEQYLKTGVIV